jgi:hypothetical protein
MKMSELTMLIGVLSCHSAVAGSVAVEPSPQFQSLPSGGISPLAQAANGPSCVAECDKVLALCRNLCRDAKVRDQIHYAGNPDLPVGQCLDDCETDHKICKQSCP